MIAAAKAGVGDRVLIHFKGFTTKIADCEWYSKTELVNTNWYSMQEIKTFVTSYYKRMHEDHGAPLLQPAVSAPVMVNTLGLDLDSSVDESSAARHPPTVIVSDSDGGSAYQPPLEMRPRTPMSPGLGSLGPAPMSIDNGTPVESPRHGAAHRMPSSSQRTADRVLVQADVQLPSHHAEPLPTEPIYHRRPMFRKILPAFEKQWTAWCKVLLVRYREASDNGNKPMMCDTLMRLMNMPAVALAKASPGAVKRHIQRLHRSAGGLEELLRLRDEENERTTEQRDRHCGDRPWTIKEEVNTMTENAAAEGRVVSKEEVDSLRAGRQACAIVHEAAPHCESKAVRRLLQTEHGLATIDSGTVAELQALHPEAKEALSVTQEQELRAKARSAARLVDMDAAVLAKLIKRHIYNSAAPGPSGWTGHHLLVLMKDEACAAGLCAIIKDLLNGEFMGDIAVQQRLCASTLVAAHKDMNNKETGGKRPIAMGEALLKTAAHYGMSQCRSQLHKLFMRIQFGVCKKGGSHRAANLIQNLRDVMSADRDDIVVLLTDLRNAFNEISRALVRRTWLSHKELEPVWQLFEFAYGGESPLLTFDDTGEVHTVLQSKEGTRQGDLLAMLGFAVGVQPLFEAALDGLALAHGIAIADDLSLVGTAEDVRRAYEKLVQLVGQYGLTVQPHKCKLLLPMQEARRDGIRALFADTQVQMVDTHIKVLGKRIACDPHNNDLLRQLYLEDARLHDVLFERLSHPVMRENAQVALMLMRDCALPRMQYATMTTNAGVLSHATSEFDAATAHSFQRLTSIKDDELNEQTRLQITLPLSEGGLGLRPVQRTSPAAFLATGVMALVDLLDQSPSTAGATLRHWTRLPLCAALQDCLDYYHNCQVDLSVDAVCKHGLLDTGQPAATLALRIRALLSGAGADEVRAHIQSGLQHRITVAHDAVVKQRVADGQSPADRARLLAVTAAGAMRALTVLPSEADFRVSGDETIALARRVLGLTPLNIDSTQQCAVHPGAGVLADDSSHGLRCWTSGYSKTTRHHRINEVLAKAARMAGASTKIEPSSLVLQHKPKVGMGDDDDDEADVSAPGTNDDAADAQDSSAALWRHPSGYDAHARRADLYVCHQHFELYVDVSVTHPAQSALLRGREPPVTRQLLVAATRVEEQKARKYAQCAAYAGETVVPFVLETYGGIGPQALRLVNKLAACMAADERTEYKERVLDMLAVALAKGNYLVESHFVRKQRMLQHDRRRAGARTRAPCAAARTEHVAAAVGGVAGVLPVVLRAA